MATFLVAFPGWRPEDYLALTQRELTALLEAHNRYHK